MRYFNWCYIMRFALSVFMLTVWSHTVHAQNVEEVLEFRKKKPFKISGSLSANDFVVSLFGNLLALNVR